MGEKTATALLETLGALRPSTPLTSGNLTILPLTSTRETKVRYVLLGEAIKRGRCLRLPRPGYRSPQKRAFSKPSEPDAVGQVDKADLPPVDGMVAAAVFVGGAFVCLDALFPGVRFGELYPKLLRGYALEALAAHPVSRCAGKAPEDPEAYALRLLVALGEAERQEQPAIDLGVDLRLDTAGHSGAGLVWDGNLIQLSVFPKVA